MLSKYAIYGVVSALLIGNVVLAQGLLHRLPKDGTWSRYRVSQQVWGAKMIRVPTGRQQPPNYPELAFIESDLLLQSVGITEVDGQPCRWIEIVRKPSSHTMSGSQRTIGLRLLVSEDVISQGKDSFDDCLRVIYSDLKNTTIELTDKDRRRYELERFRPLFPRLAVDSKRTNAVMMSSFVPGKPTTEVELYKFKFSFSGKLSGGKSGKWDHQADYKMVICDYAPFGVVHLLLHDIQNREDYGPDQLAVEMRGSTQIILLESGVGARSEFPGTDEKQNE